MFRAANDFQNKRLKSRNVHSEVVFSLSLNNNVRLSMDDFFNWLRYFHFLTQLNSLLPVPQIAESFRRFGITDTTSNLLVIKLSTSSEITHEKVQQHLRTAVEGTAVEFSDAALSKMTDMARVKKTYKINSQPQVVGKEASSKGAVNAETEKNELEVIVLGVMALRGAN